jgi:hypothetical protein
LFTTRNLAIIAVIIGATVGIALALTQQNKSTAQTSTTTSIQSMISGSDAEHILEMHGEEALIETELGGFGAIHNGFSTAPDFLRSQLEQRGLTAPEGATTEELQDLLAEAGVTMDQMHQQ